MLYQLIDPVIRLFVTLIGTVVVLWWLRKLL